MMNRCWLHIIFCILLLNCFCALSQQSQYSFRRIDISYGISHNQINTIFEDSRGFMWFGTISGLNRYDGHSFKIFRNNPNDPFTLKDNYVTKIFELPDNNLWIKSVGSNNSIYDVTKDKFLADQSSFFKKYNLPQFVLLNVLNKNGVYWFLYPGKGIYKFSSNKTVEPISIGNKNDQLADSTVTDIQFDSKDNIWAIHQNGIIEKINTVNNKVIFRSTAFQSTIAGKQHGTFSLFSDNSDELWIYCPNTTFGCYHFNPKNNSTDQYSKESGIKINNNIVNGIVQDNQGLIWIGTDHGGINLIDKKTNHISFINNEAENSRSLSENAIFSLYKSRAGLIWAGTFKSGVNLFDANAINFPLYKNHLSDKNSLPFNDVNRFVEDEKGNLWIGSNGGGLIYFDRKFNTFKTYRHDAQDANSLTNDIIIGLYYGKDHKLWIGTYFGGMDYFDGKIFHHFKHDPANINSIADDRVWDIYEDAEQNFWIATLGGGIDKYNRKKNIFYHNQVRADGIGIRSNDIAHITNDNAGNLWMATSYGIDVFNFKTLRFTHLSDSANNLSSFNINTIFCDSKGLIWAGTREGLDVYNVHTKKFQPFTTADGLPYNNVLNIVEDNSGLLWISTPNGISRIKTTKETNGNLKIVCRNFNAKDGLQSSEFNPNAALKTTAGEIIFGGPSGFNLFNPKSIKDVNNKVNVVFTDFQVLNKSIVPDEKVNGNIVLKESIITEKEVTLKYNQDIFSIEFASLNFVDPDKNKYAYKLEGFNKDWVYVDENNKRVTYTNLDPGTYTFYVKAANDAGEWSAITTQLKITVLPPFWKTPFAYFLYFLFLLAVLFFARRSVIQRARQKFAIEQERREALRMHELDMMKIKFFTNVSHEFRTPLSLIITPLDKIINTTLDVNKKKHFELMQRNARRLLNLVNQLLDFRKLETEELKLNLTKGNIIKFLNEISFSFTDMAEKKEIEFRFHSSVQSLYTSFDIDKLERIMFNLLSNAFKFTPEHGSIEVKINSIDTTLPNQKILEIRVKDSGIGIPAEKHEKIFERFFQNEVPGSMLNQGSGIGLSITKEFVKLHGGNISVESEAEKGSCFTVQLPVTILEEQISEVDESIVDDIFQHHTMADEILPEINLPKLSSKKATLLLIEDNEDFRFYLKDNLKEFYNIIEATNGKEGWQKALQFHPDLIVSDIMMPVMDGLELCNKIKADSRTSHIPVILLTARTTEENKLEGYQTGASDYITKPFNFEILQSRIKNILAQQASLRKTFLKHVEAKPTEVTVSSENEKFIQQALEIVEKNIDNADFSVEELSKGLFMSRVGLYKKIFAVTGKTPIEFIRSIRLKRAAQLLSKTQMTIAEVAYEVGFNNPKYFAKYFKAEYGMLPSAYQNKQQNKV